MSHQELKTRFTNEYPKECMHTVTTEIKLEISLKQKLASNFSLMVDRVKEY
jgi:hypothetical protein